MWICKAREQQSYNGSRPVCSGVHKDDTQSRLYPSISGKRPSVGISEVSGAWYLMHTNNGNEII